MTSCLSLVLLALCALATAHAQLRVFDLRASDLPGGLLGTTDAYVMLFCGTASLGRTSVHNNNRNPWWEKEFSYAEAEQNDVLRMSVWDSDYFLDDLVGHCRRPVEVGTHTHDCYLKKGGMLHYSYTLRAQ